MFVDIMIWLYGSEKLQLVPYTPTITEVPETLNGAEPAAHFPGKLIAAVR